MNDEKFKYRLARELKALRTARALSQGELGAEAAISRNSIYRYERGDDMPVVLFVRLCTALGADAAETLGRIIKND